jgi:hypothetical protein
VKRRRRNQAFHFAAAAFVYRQELIGKLLPDLELLPAAFAIVFVKRHITPGGFALPFLIVSDGGPPSL